MSLDRKNIQEDFKKILEFKNEDEKLQFEAEMLHLAIMNKIRILMNEKEMNKAQLAKELSTSKGYITQLFTGDKLLNLKTLVKIQRIFKVNINMEFEYKINPLEEFANTDISYMANINFNNTHQYNNESPLHVKEAKFEYCAG